MTTRRRFIKQAGMAAAATVAIPYLLPSGRLFAATGSQMASHVVFVLFAGGVRQQESVLQRYLDDSQGLSGIGGNIMVNMLNGAQPTVKVVYGTDPAIGPRGSVPIPKLLPGNQTFENMGTLFPEVEADRVGHFAGLNNLVTGNTAVTQGLKQKPLFPTIFEYTRRHLGEKATKVWFVGNGINNSVPLLNYSTHQNYGAQYGANFFAPNITFGASGTQHLSNSKIYHPDEELAPMYKMKYFLDNAFMNQGGSLLEYGIQNTVEEREQIRDFMKLMFQKNANGSIDFPPVTSNGDLRTIGYASEVIKYFKPTLTVVNLNDVDGCHSNFTGYLRNLHRADHGVAHLWNVIQNTPGMAGDTVLIAIPEHGRNLNHNPILDENDWFAYDHSDQNSKRVFALMVGKNVPAGLRVGSDTNQVGKTMDGVVTVADILGFKQDVQNAGLINLGTQSLFDRI
jgi:hypothetical protein